MNIVRNDFNAFKIKKGTRDTCDFCGSRLYFPRNVYFLAKAETDVGTCARCAELGAEFLKYGDLGYWSTDEGLLLVPDSDKSFSKKQYFIKRESLMRLYDKYPEKKYLIDLFMERKKIIVKEA